MAEKINFLSVNFTKMTQPEAVQEFVDYMRNRRSKSVYFVNANSVVIAAKDAEMQAALDRADLIMADGSGVLRIAKLKKRPLTYNLNGTDLIPEVCKEVGKHKLSVYLLGGKPGVADDVARKLQVTCPGLVVVGVQDGYFKREDTPKIVDKIIAAKPHLLLVGFGSPLQEVWIDQYADQLKGIVRVGVGGLFDFLGERVKRAPSPIRKIGLEWVWRLVLEPRRLWKRYLVGNVVFLCLVAKYSPEKQNPRVDSVQKIMDTTTDLEGPLYTQKKPVNDSSED